MAHMDELARDLASTPAITFLFHMGMKGVAERKVRYQAATGSNMQNPLQNHTGGRIGACLG